MVCMMSVNSMCGSEREGQTVGGSVERRPETEGRESKGPHCKDGVALLGYLHYQQSEIKPRFVHTKYIIKLRYYLHM